MWYLWPSLLCQMFTQAGLSLRSRLAWHGTFRLTGQTVHQQPDACHYGRSPPPHFGPPFSLLQSLPSLSLPPSSPSSLPMLSSPLPPLLQSLSSTLEVDLLLIGFEGEGGYEYTFNFNQLEEVRGWYWQYHCSAGSWAAPLALHARPPPLLPGPGLHGLREGDLPHCVGDRGARGCVLLRQLHHTLHTA